MSVSAEGLFAELEGIPNMPAARPLARHSPPSEASSLALKRGVNYSHQAMIDLILARPGISQDEIALHFGYTPSWISTIMGSDAFQSALAARREQIVDPVLRASVEEQTKGLYLRSLEILHQKLNAPAQNVSDQLALQAFAHSARALGYGARPPAPPAETDVAGALVRHADNLVNLLRKVKSTEGAIIDVPVSKEG